MINYIPADKLIAEIKRYKNKADERLKIKGRTFGEEQKDLALQNLCGNLLYFISSLQQDETQVDKMLSSQIWWEEQGWIMIPPDATIEGIDSLLREVKKKLQQEQLDFPTTDEQIKEFLATHPKIKVPEKYKNPDWLFKKQEQPEVDLEKEIIRYQREDMDRDTTVRDVARHFYELGLNARNEESK